jgi:hypothetical protein
MADESNPSTRSSDQVAQRAFWTMVDAILGGEATIKEGGTSYLPSFPRETVAKYDYRLAISPFTNIYADISNSLASKPFSQPLALVEGTPQQYLDLAENIDGQGNNHHVFCQSSFKNALDYGIDWILVDYTKAQPRTDGLPLTLADEREQGLRPYWVRIPARDMLAVYSAFIGGVETIYHARFEETAVDLVEYVEESITRVREFDRERLYDEFGNITGLGPAVWRLWEQRTDGGNKSSWMMVGEGPITIGEIPLVPVILKKRQGGSWIVDPPLRDLAYMQLAEYRQESNLEWVKIMTCFPMLSVSGILPTNTDGSQVEITVSPNVAFIIPPSSSGTGIPGEVKIVEPGAQSIVENRAQLELTRREMRDLGMQPVTEANLTVVTTANVSKKASSAVQAWAFLFKDALERAWRLTAMWLNDKSFEPEVLIHTDFAVELESGKEVDALLKAQGQGIYSKMTVREEFRRRSIVSNDITDEEEEERLAVDQEGLEAEQAIDPVTGEPIEMMAPVQKAPPGGGQNGAD